MVNLKLFFSPLGEITRFRHSDVVILAGNSHSECSQSRKPAALHLSIPKDAGCRVKHGMTERV